MRRCYLVCYDICDPRRLRRVFRIMKGYGEHWQFSVFFCTLKDIDHVRMRAELEAEINMNEDQVLIIDLGPDEQEARASATIVGQPLPSADRGMVVI